jgi:hypothetical protein
MLVLAPVGVESETFKYPSGGFMVYGVLVFSKAGFVCLVGIAPKACATSMILRSASGFLCHPSCGGFLPASFDTPINLTCQLVVFFPPVSSSPVAQWSGAVNENELRLNFAINLTLRDVRISMNLLSLHLG